jgi:hypothetical protein
MDTVTVTAMAQASGSVSATVDMMSGDIVIKPKLSGSVMLEMKYDRRQGHSFWLKGPDTPGVKKFMGEKSEHMLMTPVVNGVKDPRITLASTVLMLPAGPVPVPVEIAVYLKPYIDLYSNIQQTGSVDLKSSAGASFEMSPTVTFNFLTGKLTKEGFTPTITKNFDELLSGIVFAKAEMELFAQFSAQIDVDVMGVETSVTPSIKGHITGEALAIASAKAGASGTSAGACVKTTLEAGGTALYKFSLPSIELKGPAKLVGQQCDLAVKFAEQKVDAVVGKALGAAAEKSEMAKCLLDAVPVDDGLGELFGKLYDMCDTVETKVGDLVSMVIPDKIEALGAKLGAMVSADSGAFKTLATMTKPLLDNQVCKGADVIGDLPDDTAKARRGRQARRMRLA